MGRDGSVGIATGYRLNGLGDRIPVGGRDFPHLSRPALGPNQPPVLCVPGLSRGKEQPGRDADPSILLVPWSRKSRSLHLLPLWAVRPVQSLSACTVDLYLYSPPWAVRPVQSLIACTRVHFTLPLHKPVASSTHAAMLRYAVFMYRHVRQ